MQIPMMRYFAMSAGRNFSSHVKKQKKCPACNAENPKEAEFCHACGKRMSINKPIQSPTNKYTNTPSNNEMGIMGWIVVGGIIAIMIFTVIGIIGEFVDLIRLIGLIFN